MNVLAPRRAAGLALALLCMTLSSSSLAAGEFQIRGRVLNEKGQPVKGTLVAAVCTGALPEGPHIDCGFPGMMGRKTTTDGEGAFSLERLPAAVYSVYAAIEAKDNGGTATEVALRVELRQSQERLELRAAPLHALSGLVVDNFGSPVPDAEVRVRMKREDRPAGATERSTQGSARTNAQGQFEVKGLVAGPFALEVRREGYSPLELPQEVRPGTPVTVKLQRCALVRGRAVGPDGAAVARVSSDNRGFESQLPDGRFEERYCGDDLTEVNITLQAPGMAALPLKVSLKPGQQVDLGDVRMEAARVLRVRVTDKARRQPVQGASVEFVEPLASSVQTDATGWATFSDQPDKAIELRVRASGLVPTRVKVAKGQTEVQVALHAGLGMRGRALDARGGPQLGAVSVSCPEDTGTQAQLGPDGTFTIPGGLAPGLCSVTLQSYTSPMPSFEQFQFVWLDPRKPLHVEFRAPAERHPLQVRFSGAGKPHRAVLLLGQAPAQLSLEGMVSRTLMANMHGGLENQGYRAGRWSEGAFTFKDVGPGPYTLVVVMGDGVFRAPITMGTEPQTVTVSIPRKLTPLPR